MGVRKIGVEHRRQGRPNQSVLVVADLPFTTIGEGFDEIERSARSRSSARPLVGELGALVAILIIDGLLYFHYTAAKFNHDVIQLPLWALKSAKKAKVRCGWCSIADASLAARGVIVPARLTDGSQFACASNRIELLGCR